MTYLKKLGGTVGVTGALILVAGGWVASAEGATVISPAVDVQAAAAEAFGDTERAESVLGAAIPTAIRLQPTLQQRSRRGGARRVAQPRRGGGAGRSDRRRARRTLLFAVLLRPRLRLWIPVLRGWGLRLLRGELLLHGISQAEGQAAGRGRLGRWLLRRNRRRLRRDLPESEVGAGSGEHRGPRPGLRGLQARRHGPGRPQDHVRGEHEGGRSRPSAAAVGRPSPVCTGS